MSPHILKSTITGSPTGHLLKNAAGHLLLSERGGVVPSSCPCPDEAWEAWINSGYTNDQGCIPGWSGFYKVNGAQSIDPTGCDNARSLQVDPWDGIITAFFDSRCVWEISFEPEEECDTFKTFTTGNIPLLRASLSLSLFPFDVWRLRLQYITVNSDFECVTERGIWLGLKRSGQDPDGIYIKDSGCAVGPSSLTVTRA